MKRELIGRKWHAYDLLKFLQDRGFSLDYPIDVDEVARFLGIKIKEDLDIEHIGDIGYIKIENGEPIIWVNPFLNQNPYRRRFTIAHELGHFCLHIAPEGKDKSFIDTEDSLKRSNLWDIKEYQANSFAADLLMPAILIKQVGEKLSNDYKEKYGKYMTVEEFVDSMSKIFKVSKQAMRYRLINLGIINE